MDCRALCLERDTTDSVHDLRVACRRLRAALQLVGAFSNGKKISKVSSVIRKVTREIGILRNLDEALLFMRNEFNTEKQFVDLVEKISLQRTKEALRLHRHIKHLDTETINHTLKSVTARLVDKKQRVSETCWIGFLSDNSMKLYTGIDELLPYLFDDEASEKRHALRIAIKRWRYYLEIVAELTHRDYDLSLDDLKEYQTLLGRLNDLKVFSVYAADSAMTETERDLFEAAVAAARSVSLDALAEISNSRPLRYSFQV